MPFVKKTRKYRKPKSLKIRTKNRNINGDRNKNNCKTKKKYGGVREKEIEMTNEHDQHDELNETIKHEKYDISLLQKLKLVLKDIEELVLSSEEKFKLEEFRDSVSPIDTISPDETLEKIRLGLKEFEELLPKIKPDETPPMQTDEREESEYLMLNELESEYEKLEEMMLSQILESNDNLPTPPPPPPRHEYDDLDEDNYKNMIKFEEEYKKAIKKNNPEKLESNEELEEYPIAPITEMLINPNNINMYNQQNIKIPNSLAVLSRLLSALQNQVENKIKLGKKTVNKLLGMINKLNSILLPLNVNKNDSEIVKQSSTILNKIKSIYNSIKIKPSIDDIIKTDARDVSDSNGHHTNKYQSDNFIDGYITYIIDHPDMKNVYEGITFDLLIN